MTEKEQALFDKLQKEGWFLGEEKPEILASFDLSRERVTPPDWYVSLNKKKKKKENTIPQSEGLALCDGVALIYLLSASISVSFRIT